VQRKLDEEDGKVFVSDGVLKMGRNVAILQHARSFN
jgi:hypothetical protein